MAWFRRRSSALSFEEDETLRARSFPTEDYVTLDEGGDAYPQRYSRLQAEAAGEDDRRRADRVAVIDDRVISGPTTADRAHIPYVEEAWEWAESTNRLLGLKRRRPPYGCVLDMLTRMRVAALLERRNLVWPETAVRTAGLDPARIEVEHGVRPEDVAGHLSRAREWVTEGLENGWDGVVWGDVDTDDPLRTIEIDGDSCGGCGQCVVLCPEAFAKSADGVAYVLEPTAVRSTEFEECCMMALEQCAEGAIRLNTRGGRTVTGVVPPRGRPLPGSEAPA